MSDVRVKFLKKRYYNKKEYNVGDTASISQKDLPAYLSMGVCEICKNSVSIKTNLKKILEGKTYKALQAICKSKNISAVGKKEDLVSSLLKKDGDINV